MKATIAAIGALVSFNAMSATPEEAVKPAGASAPTPILGYAIGQKLEACPAGSKATAHEHRKFCSLGPTTYAGANALDYSITIFNGEIIGTRITLDTRKGKPGAQVMADLRARFGEPDGVYSRPDLDSHIWVRGSLVAHFDGSGGSVVVMDVIKTEVAKLRAAPSNQVDF